MNYSKLTVFELNDLLKAYNLELSKYRKLNNTRGLDESFRNETRKKLDFYLLHTCLLREELRKKMYS